MANEASAERVQADIRPPDYRAAVKRIRTIKAKKDKISSINGEIADVWGKVEGHKVNRQAAKIFAKLDGLEPIERADIIRSLNGLMDAAEWPSATEDLADMAEGNVVPMRLGKDAGDDGDGPEDEEEEGEEEEEEEEEPAHEPVAKHRGAATGMEALQASKARFAPAADPKTIQ